ncbi:MAG: hypothetical protein SGPRY_006343, partial [Prymnesium sp.]
MGGGREGVAPPQQCTPQPPRGLINLGNTCYLNAAIQALAHCPPLFYFFEACAPLYTYGQMSGESSALVASFARVLHLFASPPPSIESDAIKPLDLYRATQAVLPHFELNAQQDAQELLRALLDVIHETLKRPLSDGELTDFRGRLRVEWRECTGLEWKDEAQAAYEAQLEAKAREAQSQTHPLPPPPPPPRPATSPIVQLFEGQLLSAVKCLNCSRTSYTRDSFLDLSLAIPSHRKHRREPSKSFESSRHSAEAVEEEEESGRLPNGRKKSRSILSRVLHLRMSGDRPLGLSGALSTFFEAEEMTGDEKYNCEHCRALHDGRKHLAIFRPPNILSIHLKRFRFGVQAKKASDHVAFPLTGLSLKPFCTESVKGSAEYDLAAVVTHHGASLSSGHYTAYVCARTAKDSTWYHVDDSREVTAERVLQTEAYMLFYVRRMQPEHKELASHTADAINHALASYPSSTQQASEARPELLISRGWLARFFTTDDPGAVAHSDVLCEHGAVDVHRGCSLEAAHQSCVRVPRAIWDDLVDRFKEGAPPAPPVPRLMSCAVCLELHKQEVAALQEERDEISSLDSTEIQPGDLTRTPTAILLYYHRAHPLFISILCELWYLLDALWLKHWREYCWDGTRIDPPGPVSNWRLLRDGRARPGQVRARDYRGVNQKVWAVFMRRPASSPLHCCACGLIRSDPSRYGGGPAIRRHDLNL